MKFRALRFVPQLCLLTALLSLAACSGGGNPPPLDGMDAGVFDTDAGPDCPMGTELVGGVCVPACEGSAGLDCQNGGVCVVDGATGDPTCECAAGYAGELCDECDAGYQDTNDDGVCNLACDAAADPLVCSNGGTCLIDDGGERFCECPEGTAEDDCSECAAGYAQTDGGCMLNLPPMSDLALWLDAERGVSVTGSGTVATWSDRRGAGYPIASELDNDERPVLEEVALSGRDTVFFDGDDDRLAVAGFDGLSSSHYAIFVVASPTSPTSSQRVISFRQAGTAFDAASLDLQNPSFEFTFSHRSGAMAADEVTVAAEKGRGPVTLSVVRHDAQGTTFDRQSALTSAAAYDQVTELTNGPLTSGTLTLGFGTGEAFGGHIAEVLIYDRSLSSEERVAVLQYLAAKWGAQLSAL